MNAIPKNLAMAKKTLPGGMHPADIKALIEKAGSSQAAIARAMNISDVAVNHIIYGRSSSRRVAGYIATLTGKRLADLWPGRYADDSAG
jgi:lambda repressor-like predicted transcriptional regulator